jgi:hypothetical protein
MFLNLNILGKGKRERNIIKIHWNRDSLGTNIPTADKTKSVAFSPQAKYTD